MSKKKLIEVALPLEAINSQSAREKSIRHGHPSTLHLWWARRPLATARAVLFAQLVDDPGESFDAYVAEAQRGAAVDAVAHATARVDAEREYLFDLIARMVNWDNLGDEALFDEVRAEIRRSTNDNPPSILDPFAGGGTIPLEAQRLGLEAQASDLNPVAVLINKALIEVPPMFAGSAPVFPDARQTRIDWPNASGLAEDVRRYGEWMRDEAQKRIGHLYPKSKLTDSTETNVIAWVWARTITCPNPACGIEMPLVRSWWLGKKRGREAYVIPSIINGRVEYSIGHDPKHAPPKDTDGTISGRRGATCIACKGAVSMGQIKEQGITDGLGTALIATVAEGNRQRLYLAPNGAHIRAAEVDTPKDIPLQRLGHDPRNIWTPPYGLDTFASLFTNRQLTALTTLSDLVSETRERVLLDITSSPEKAGQPPVNGPAYADAIATYLGLAISRCLDYSNALCTWHNGRETVRNLFARQAIPMAWDFVETNVFSNSTGNFLGQVEWVARTIDALPAARRAQVTQADAATRAMNGVVSTDPPYYDNIGYSDLSDFFYVWLRRSLRSVHPSLLSTMLVPKAEELVANPYRHEGKDGARTFFETGFEHVFKHAREHATNDYPITVYYAFKQSETDIGGTASTGWETILGSMVRAGWTVTATWPVRSELGNRMIASGTNALASSIVLALRPRPEDAPIIDRRGFLSELKRTLPGALRDLQQGSIAPVDMAQAAIGPGMAIFSRYARVVEPSGENMGVRDALRAINGVLDEVLSQQEGDFDDDTRWCIAWFETHGFEVSLYGEAETLASAKNSSVAGLARAGVISSGAGKVKLFPPDELPEGYDPRTDDRISLWEVVLHMARALSAQGLDSAGRILAGAEARGVDTASAHELAYLLYSIAEKKGLTQAGILFNTLGSSWPEVRAAAASAAEQPEVLDAPTLDFDDLEA